MARGKPIKKEEVKTPNKSQIAIRQKSLEWGNWLYELPNPDYTFGKLGVDPVEAYKELESNPKVYSVIEQRKAGINDWQWDVNRGTDSDSEAAEIAINVIKSWDLVRIFSEILDCRKYGYQPHEIIWGFDSGLYVPIDLIGRPYWWFKFDDDGMLRFKSKNNPFKGDRLPSNKFVLSQHNATYDNPYGESLLSRCYWPAKFLKNGENFWAKFLERFAAPMPVGKTDQSNTVSLNNLQTALTNYVIGGGTVTIEREDSIELPQGNTSGSTSAYMDFVDYQNKRISEVWLGHEQATSGTPGKLGSEDTQIEVRDDLIESDGARISQTINEVLKIFWRVNMLGDDVPVFGMYAPESVNTELADRDTKLNSIGVRFTKNYFSDKYHLNDDEFDLIEGLEPDNNNIKDEKDEEFAEFAESRFPDQAAIDSFIENIPEKYYSKCAKGMIDPVIKAVKEAKDFKSLDKSLSSIYKDMDSGFLETFVFNNGFLVNQYGRQSARIER